MSCTEYKRMINKRERRLIHLVDKLNWIDEAQEKGLYDIGTYTNKINKYEYKIKQVVLEILKYEKLVDEWQNYRIQWEAKQKIKIY